MPFELSWDGKITGDTIVQAAALLLSVGGAVVAWLSVRRGQLRIDEVIAWANKSIECLQTIALLTRRTWYELPKQERADRLADLSIQASVLIEQGRLFFKNHRPEEFGTDKLLAYQGLRPLILDELVVAHELARDWSHLSLDDRNRGYAIAVLCLKRFVSMAQQEVGRDRAASLNAASGGDGPHFAELSLEMKETEEIKRPEITRKRRWWVAFRR
jgi:hypothetical protein